MKGKWQGIPMSTLLWKEDPLVEDICKLLDELAKQEFVFRMALARKLQMDEEHSSTQLAKYPLNGKYASAKTRAENAARLIDNIIRKYVQTDAPPTPRK